MSYHFQEQREAVLWGDVYGNWQGNKTHSGTPVDEERALKYSVVWRAVSLIADAIAHLTPYAQTEDEIKGQTKRVALPQWVRRPHPTLLRHEVWHQLLVSLLLWGNAYALLIRRPSDGMVVGLLPLDPGWVQAEWDPYRDGGIVYRRYRIVSGTTGLPTGWLAQEDVLHISGLMLPGQAVGLSAIQQAKQAVGLGLTLEEFGARYFAQGSTHKVVLTTPKTIGEEQAKQMVKVYELWHRGPMNWHRPAVAYGGATIQNVSIPPEDAQFLESREFQALDVAAWFGVPPHRVGLISKQTSWGSGLAEENTATVQYAFRPWIMRFEAALTAYAPYGEDRGTKIRLEDATLLRGSFKEQVDAWGVAYEKGLATRNEGRKGIGLSAVAGGDEFKETPPPGQFGQGPPNRPPNQRPDNEQDQGDEQQDDQQQKPPAKQQPKQQQGKAA